MLPLILYTGLAWGSGGLVSKGLVNDGVDAFVVTAAPFAVAALIALVVDVRATHPDRRAIGAGLFLGTVNTALPALFFNIGYETLPAGLLTLILSVGPVVTAVVAHFVFVDEPFRPAKAAGLGLSFAGVAVLSLAPGVIEGTSYVGLAWVLAGVAIAGSTAVLSRRFAVAHGGRRLVGAQLPAAAITPIALGLITGRPMIPTAGFEAWHIVALLAIGTFASYGGFRAVMRASEIGTTGQVSVIGYLIPVVGVAGGALFFGERITTAVLVGGVLIVAGVGITGRASGKPARLIRSAG